ncbi:YlaI family protein [Bacillus badius]|uniref:YlaI family protein n=1 Tax=Bacillus badius TaxID=1455 RepID=UPI001CBC6095|nr:YlaI family protein [Bacillus badius]UAT31690.1 YlaI family protein [Bacillus badius]
MRVKCILCEKIEKIDDQLPVAKRLRNRPIHTYMCTECSERIAKKTQARIATGKFRIYRSGKEQEIL